MTSDPIPAAMTPIDRDVLFDRLIELVYEATLDTPKWRDVAQTMSEALGGHAVTVWVHLPGTTSELESYKSTEDEVSNDVIREHWNRGLPWGNVIPEDGSGHDTLVRFVDFDSVFPNEQLAETDYYKEWLEPRGLLPRSPYVHVFAHDGSTPLGAVSLYQRKGLPLLDADDIAFADRIAPHLSRAHRILDNMRSMQHEHDIFREVIDRIPSGMVLVDQNGGVVAVNEAARLSMESGEGLQIRDGRPVVDDPEQNRWFQDTLDKARDPATRANVEPDGAPDARRAGGKSNIPVMVTPLLSPASESTLPDTAAVIFLGSPKLAHTTATNLLRTLYELTRAEAELTWLLADGLSLEEAAANRGVTLNTARSQLKRVFAKTGAKRQSDLVRIVLGGVGSMRGPS